MSHLMIERTSICDMIILFDVEAHEIEKIKILNHYVPSLYNNIYWGRVVNVVDHLNGAFIDVGLNENVFMPRNDLVRALKLPRSKSPLSQIVKGKPMLLGQISVDSYQGKSARLKSDIALTSLHFVLLPFSKGIKKSKKINIIHPVEAVLNDYFTQLDYHGGLILRSAIADVPSHMDLSSELEELIVEWQAIQQEIKLLNHAKCLYEADDEKRIIKSFMQKATIDTCTVTRLEDRDLLMTLGFKRLEIKIDTSHVSLIKKNAINIDRLLTENVWSQSNGLSFTLDELEAFTIIDVNSGHYQTTKKRQEAIVEMNLKISTSILDLIKKRNISGNILIDYIGHQTDYTDSFLKTLEQNIFTKDEDFTLVGVSSLGLLELTRKRTGASLVDLLSECISERDLIYWQLTKLYGELNYMAYETRTEKVTLCLSENLYIFIMNHHPFEDLPLKIIYEKDKRKNRLYSLKTL